MILRRIMVSRGRRGYLLETESGRKYYYDTEGHFLINVESPITEEEETEIDSEREFIKITNLTPSAFPAICLFCLQEELTRTTLQMWFCFRCQNLVPVTDETEREH